jgi:predicted  nucleic acid-binding Zn ribbon protein
MFIYQILFEKAVWPQAEKEPFLRDADFFIRSLRSNGQLVSRNDVFLFQENAVSLHVQCLKKDSLEERYNSDYVNQWISVLMERYGVTVSYQYMGEHLVQVPTAEVDASSSFILYWGGPSPVRSGDTFDQIPLYHLPYTSVWQRNYEDINSWSHSYAEIDGLWFRGSMGEKHFHQFLSDINSPLTTQGRSICNRLEQLTGKPSYYYLFNADNKASGHHCPSCGGEWQLESKLLAKFDLKCDHCRLVSNQFGIRN